MARVVDNPTSPSPRGIEDRVTKVTDASVGADTIILFSLAMAQTEGKKRLEENPKSR